MALNFYDSFSLLALGCCDPHITTLDEGSYTFNGLGEYVLLRTDSEDFEVQARTKLAAPNTTATAFSAIAVSDSNRSSIVEVRFEGRCLSI